MSEGYCDKLLRADREKFGIIPNVTDKDWYHNSFHVASNHKLSATEKQLIESPLFHRSNGGHIVYNEFYTVDNFEAFSTIIDHAMKEGLYYGINLELGKCNDCGYESAKWLGRCPSCSAWNTFEEAVIQTEKTGQRSSISVNAKAKRITEVEAITNERE